MIKRKSSLRALIAIVAGLFATLSVQQGNVQALVVSGAVILFVVFSGETYVSRMSERFYLVPLVLGASSFCIAISFLIFAYLENDTHWLTGIGIVGLSHYLFKESNVYRRI